MSNKTKKILACACLGLVGMGCLVGCDKQQGYEDYEDCYELTVINDSRYGIISPILDNETNSVSVDRGDNYTFTITPQAGYQIDNLIIDGKLLEPQSVYTFENIENDHSIGAIYSRKIKSLKVVGIEFMAVYETMPDEYVVSGDSMRFGIRQRDDYDIATTKDAKDIFTFVNAGYVAGDGSMTVRCVYGPLSGVTCHNNIEFGEDGKYGALLLCSYLDKSSTYNAYATLSINLDELNSEGYYHGGVYSLPVHGWTTDSFSIFAESGNKIIISNLELICEVNYYV